MTKSSVECEVKWRENKSEEWEIEKKESWKKGHLMSGARGMIWWKKSDLNVLMLETEIKLKCKFSENSVTSSREKGKPVEK